MDIVASYLKWIKWEKEHNNNPKELARLELNLAREKELLKAKRTLSVQEYVRGNELVESIFRKFYQKAQALMAQGKIEYY